MDRTGTGRQFAIALTLITVVALAVRLAFIMFVTRHGSSFGYDTLDYQFGAAQLAEGRGFQTIFGESSAAHPPLTILFLAPVWKLTGNVTMMRCAIATVGVGTVALIGLLAADVFGRRAGVVAAALAAIYPLVWVNDGLIMSETLAVCATTAALPVAYRCRRNPTLGRAALIGVASGLAALARAELILLVPALVGGVVFGLRSEPKVSRLRIAGIGVLAATVVVGPWVVYNLNRFERPAFLSTSSGLLLASSSCDTAFYGPNTGTIDYECLSLARGRVEPVGGADRDESQHDADYRRLALRYIRQHPARFPVVVLARIGRDWSVFRPFDALSAGATEGRPRWVTGLGLGFYYPVLALAVAGLVILIRRRLRYWPLLVPPLILTASTIVSWGHVRFRSVSEPSLVVLAAVGIVAGAGYLTRPGRRSAAIPNVGASRP